MLLQQWKADTESILRSSKVYLTHDDYREFLELCMFFLGCQQSITFKQPGAFHKARWMSKLLYSIKITLMQDQIQQLPQGTVTTKHQLPKIGYSVLCNHHLQYVVVHMSCCCGCSMEWPEPIQVSLGIWRHQGRYTASAVKALKRHFWYLTEEMIPLSLFSEIVPSQERQALACGLLELKPDQATCGHTKSIWHRLWKA